MPCVIEITNVTLRRGGSLLLDSFSWRLPDPGVYLLQGGNAAGKSLLCRLLAGREKPQQGTVTIDGEPLYRLFGGYARPLALWTADDPCPAEETVEGWIETELRLLGGSLHQLHPSRTALEDTLGLALAVPLARLSRGQFVLAQLALAALAPVRLALLDGQLALLDQANYARAAALLRTRIGEEKCILLTAIRLAAALPEIQEVFALTGGCPIRLKTAQGTAEDGVPLEAKALRLYIRDWIPGALQVTSGASYVLVQTLEDGLRIRLSGTLDEALAELSAQNLRITRIEWDAAAP
jgi:ABC-type multidrug transport system ATPase subunit